MNNFKFFIRGLVFVFVVTSFSCAQLPPEKEPKSPEKDLDSSTSQLAEKTWLLAGYQAESGFIPLEPEHGSSAYIEFNTENRFSGTTGINRFMGNWKLGKSKNAITKEIRLEQIGTTLMAAPNEIAMQFERDILDHLDAAATFKIGQDTLSFYDSKGKKILTFIFQKPIETQAKDKLEPEPFE